MSGVRRTCNIVTLKNVNVWAGATLLVVLNCPECFSLCRNTYVIGLSFSYTPCPQKDVSVRTSVFIFQERVDSKDGFFSYVLILIGLCF